MDAVFSLSWALFMAYVQVPDGFSKTFQSLVFWLNDDDTYFEAKLNFLNFLSCTSLTSFEAFLPDPEILLPPPPPPPPPPLLPISLDNVPLTHSAIQYLIDVSPCIVDKPSLVYFLNLLHIKNKDNFPLICADFPFNFNYRLRASKPVYEGRRRVFPNCDSFLIKRPKFKERFLDLVCRGDFP